MHRAGVSERLILSDGGPCAIGMIAQGFFCTIFPDVRRTHAVHGHGQFDSPGPLAYGFAFS
jgi:hypothetical protein